MLTPTPTLPKRWELRPWSLPRRFGFPPTLPGPDGIAFGKSGKPGGSPDPLPWANPSNIAFDNHTRSLLVDASLVPYDPNLFVVFDVFVDDKGQPLP